MSCAVFESCDNVVKALQHVDTGGQEFGDEISGPGDEYCEDIFIALS